LNIQQIQEGFTKNNGSNQTVTISKDRSGQDKAVATKIAAKIGRVSEETAA
jgi:ketol-acid reductoisomerase